MIQWTKEYETGIAIFDEQHKILFNVLNKLYTIQHSSLSDSQVNRIIDELEEFADLHFKTEETFLCALKKLDCKSHICEHDFFLDSLKRFREVTKSNNAVIIQDMINFLSKWISHHIKNSDKFYARILKEFGAEFLTWSKAG